MAFKEVEEMDEEDFLLEMRHDAKTLKIIDVKELRESESGDGGYFYMSFENPESFQTFDMGFNVKMNESGSLYIGSKAKLHPILSYFSGMTKGIECYYEDIKALEGKSFMAKTKREKFGNKKYFIIYPVEE